MGSVGTTLSLAGIIAIRAEALQQSEVMTAVLISCRDGLMLSGASRLMANLCVTDLGIRSGTIADCGQRVVVTR